MRVCVLRPRAESAHARPFAYATVSKQPLYPFQTTLPIPCLPRVCVASQVVAAGDALDVAVRLAAAVNFKNLVKYRWVRDTKTLLLAAACC